MKAIREKHSGIFSSLSYLLYMAALIIPDAALRAMYGFAGASDTYETGLVPWIFTVCFAFVFVSLAVILPSAATRVFMLLTSAAFGILAVANAAMYKIFGAFLSFSDLGFAGEGAKFFSLSYIDVRKLLVALVIGAFVLALAAAVLLPKKRKSAPRRIIFALLFSVGIGMLFWQDSALTVVINNDSTDIMTWDVVLKEEAEDSTEADALAEEAPVTMETIYTEFTNPNACLNLTGLYQYTFRGIYMIYDASYHNDRENSLAAIDKYAETRGEADQNSMTGVFEGKNVIMIMAESLDTWMISEDYTPNIYALRENSINFVNNYTPLYLTAGTFGTEFVSLTGIIPPVTGLSNDAYAENTLPYTLPKLFSEKGYAANSFHSQPGIIYNRFAVHGNLGFRAYYTNFDMGMDDDTLDSQLINGFQYMAPADKPFFSFVITYSGHGPYDISMDGIAAEHLERAREAVAASGVQSSEANMEEYTRAIAQIMQTDDFIGSLVAALTESGQLDDTVIILYGDHYGKYMSDSDFLMELKGVENRNLLCNTPYMIYSADTSPMTVEKYVSSVDMYPTICNLFGLTPRVTSVVGDDAFGDGGGYVYWRDYSWYDGTTYYEDGASMSLAPALRRRAQEVRMKLNISWNTMKYDYYAQ